MAKLREITASFVSSMQDCELRAATSAYRDVFKQAGYSVPWLGGGHVAAVVGKGAHKSVEHLMAGKLETGMMPPVDEAISAGADLLRKDWKDGVEIDDVTRNAGEGIDQIARITKTYAGLIGYKTEPLLVETRLFMKLDSIAPGWTGSGKVDIYTKDLTIPDLKTGSLRMTPVVNMAQLGFSSLLLKANKKPVKEVGTIGIPRQSLSEDPIRPVETWFDRPLAERYAWNGIKRFTERFEKFVVSGEADEFSTNPASFFCKATACNAWDFCPVGRQKQQLIQTKGK